MKPYIHPAQAEREVKESIRERLTSLRRLEAAIQAESIAKENHLHRLYAERRRWQRAGSYTPSAEAIAYREQHGHIIAAQPRPIHGGLAGLRAAAEEAENWEARKTRQHD
jgi:hypothetical protein